MSLTVEATYENGVLKPDRPLPFKEHERVRITIQSRTNSVEETYGICGWKGDPEELRRLALAPEFDLPEEPCESENVVRRSYGLIGWTGDVETLRRVAEDAEFDMRESS
jgi:predicted DNA-binding antitoxin AbrB/MazE fold protein